MKINKSLFFNFLKKKTIVRLILIFDFFFQIIFSPLFFLIFVFSIFFCKSKHKQRFFFGPVSVLNNKYWANSLKKNGFKAESWVIGIFDNINKSSDFDKIIFAPVGILRIYYFFISITQFDIFVFSFSGGFLDRTVFWKFEALLLKILNKKIIIIPYGADFYQYSKIEDFKRRHTLIARYPYPEKNESEISSKVIIWTKNADVIIPGYLIEGLYHWDMLPYSPICLDTHNFNRSKNVNSTNGLDPKNPIRIVHSPNHRIIKGTEFIIDAINSLKQDGYFIEFELLENIQNFQVRKILMESDILIDQIHSGYALSAMEGMASGCVVISNITRKPYENIMRTFSYLNECPIVSANNFDLKDQLRLLIDNPKLRNSLSANGQDYVKKYHSFDSSKEMFLLILKYIRGEASREELINYYHPILGQAYKSKPKIITKLIRNKIRS